jgi:hypothetical protein
LDEIKEWIEKSRHMPDILSFPIRSGKALDIDKVVKNTIEGVKRKRYNLSNRKPGRNQGLRKEE